MLPYSVAHLQQACYLFAIWRPEGPHTYWLESELTIAHTADSHQHPDVSSTVDTDTRNGRARFAVVAVTFQTRGRPVLDVVRRGMYV